MQVSFMVIAIVITICKSQFLERKKAHIRNISSSYNEAKMITENKQQKSWFDFLYIRSAIILYIHTLIFLLLLYAGKNFLKKQIGCSFKVNYIHGLTKDYKFHVRTFNIFLKS